MNNETNAFIIINVIFTFRNWILVYYTNINKNHDYILKD